MVEFFEIFKNEDIGLEILKQISVLASTKRLQIEGEGLGGGDHFRVLRGLTLHLMGCFLPLSLMGVGGESTHHFKLVLTVSIIIKKTWVDPPTPHQNQG